MPTEPLPLSGGAGRCSPQLLRHFFGTINLKSPEAKEARAIRDLIKTLLKTCEDFSARRNEIAHGKVIRLELLGEIAESVGLEVDQTFYLMPPRYNSNKVPSLSSNLNVEVRRGEDRCAKIRDALTNLIRGSAVGKFRYNGEQVGYYADRFRELIVESRKLVDRLDALPKP